MFVEARADARTVAALIDKVLLEHEERPTWLDEGLLPHLRAWVTLDSTERDDGAGVPHVTWARFTERVRRGEAPRVLGHRPQGPTLHPYAYRARTAIVASVLAPTGPNAVVLVVDADSQPERLKGLEEARRAQNANILVIVGMADPEREAWVLNGFVPGTAAPASLVGQCRADTALASAYPATSASALSRFDCPSRPTGLSRSPRSREQAPVASASRHSRNRDPPRRSKSAARWS